MASAIAEGVFGEPRDVGAEAGGGGGGGGGGESGAAAAGRDAEELRAAITAGAYTRQRSGST
jgi:hypothetical protein